MNNHPLEKFRATPEAKLKNYIDLPDDAYDKESTFQINNEKDEAGIDIEGEIYWTKLIHDGKAIEGKLYFPTDQATKQMDSKLIIFAPGMPGDSNQWIEARHLQHLLREGYTVFCLRHNGSKTDVENANKIVNCPERIERSNELGQTLGNEETQSLEDIYDEVSVPLNVLGEKFDNIFLIGHSTGVASITHSLARAPRTITDKIQQVIGIAGFIGDYDPETNAFDSEGKFDVASLTKYYEYCQQFINLAEADELVEQNKKLFKNIHSTELPKNIRPILVNSMHDEYIPASTAKNYQRLLGRGLVIIDQEKPENKIGEFHDVATLKPQTLLRLLQIKIGKNPHNIEVGK